MEKINISERLRMFDKYWQSKLVGELNNQTVKLAKMKGDFDWHNHKTEDEMLLALKGQIRIEFEKETVVLDEGDLFIIPCNTTHRLTAVDEVHVMMIEPKSTVNMDTIRKGKQAVSVKE